MLSPCRCSELAEPDLRKVVGMKENERISDLEVEFREVPYFLVTRSQSKWDPAAEDINVIDILAVNDRGIVVDADCRAEVDAEQAGRRTLIPWTNIVSLSITRAAHGAGGT